MSYEAVMMHSVCSIPVVYMSLGSLFNGDLGVSVEAPKRKDEDLIVQENSRNNDDVAA